MMPPPYYHRHLFRILCLTFTLYSMSINFSVSCNLNACLGKTLKVEGFFSEPMTCHFNQSENEHEGTVSKILIDPFTYQH
jgi:hypothetical protein